MDSIRNLSAVQWSMLAAGFLIILGGLLILWKVRRGAPRPSERDNGHVARHRSPLLRHCSSITGLVIGIAALIAGYHVAIWAFPPDVNPVQFPRHLWWALFGGLALVVLLSLWIDRIDAPRTQGPT
jgi:uncharacterized membrane protein HdeD (DUF308 family)